MPSIGMERRHSLALSFLAVLVVTAALESYGITNSRPPSSAAFSYWGLFLLLLAVVGGIAIVLVFMGWIDPFDRAEYEAGSWKGIITLGALIFIPLVLMYLRRKEQLELLANMSKTNVTSTAVIPPSGPLGSSENFSSVTQRAPPSFDLGLWVLVVILVGIFIVALFGIKYYRDIAVRRKKAEIKKKAREFDDRLESLGLDMFDNPRDAVVGIYKNDVLWLEYLGVPYQESWTHWEHAGHVKYMHDSFVELTKLFEKAKYAPEKVSWDDAKRALEVYTSMRRGIDEAE